MLDLDPGMMAWTWITFAIVFFILYKLALKPIIAAIEQREKSVKDDLESAQKQRDEAAELLERHQKLIATAESEAQKIIRENQELAQKTRQQMLDETRGEAAKMVEKAKQEIEQQKESAIASLKQEVADLAIGAAEKVLTRSLDADMHKKLVDEYISSMPKSVDN